MDHSGVAAPQFPSTLGARQPASAPGLPGPLAVSGVAARLPPFLHGLLC